MGDTMDKDNKSELKSITMKKLQDENPLVFDKVVQMLDTGRKQDFIISYLNSKGYKFSKQSLSAFRKKMIESREKNIPLDELLDKRRKDSINNVPAERIHGYSGNSTTPNLARQPEDNYHDAVVGGKAIPRNNTVYSVPQALEMIIQKGMNTIENVDVVDSGTLLKSIDLLSKYFPDNRGLTQSALEQYQMIMQAQSQAIKDVLMAYVPKEQIPEALQEMDDASKRYLDAYGADEEGRKLLDALTHANLEF